MESPPKARAGHPTFFLIFVLLLAPVGAAVVVSVLLLFGVRPALVFAPGWAVKGALESLGMHAPNAVGVLCTVGVWWLLIVLAGVAWDRWRVVP